MDFSSLGGRSGDINLRRFGFLSTLASFALVVPMAAPTLADPEVTSPAVAVSDLPSMFIELTDEDPLKNTLDHVHLDKDNEVDATVNLVDPGDPANTLTDLPGLFEGRGNFTWSLEKKPYQISSGRPHRCWAWPRTARGCRSPTTPTPC